VNERRGCPTLLSLVKDWDLAVLITIVLRIDNVTQPGLSPAPSPFSCSSRVRPKYQKNLLINTFPRYR
jgi:hypothetical protein